MAIVRFYDKVLQVPWRNLACFVSVDQRMDPVRHPPAFSMYGCQFVVDICSICASL